MNFIYIWNECRKGGFWRSFVLYEVRVVVPLPKAARVSLPPHGTSPGQHWHVFLRYSELAEFASRLKNLFPNSPISVPFPRRTWPLPGWTANPTNRAGALEAWLKAALSHSNQLVRLEACLYLDPSRSPPASQLHDASMVGWMKHNHVRVFAILRHNSLYLYETEKSLRPAFVADLRNYRMDKAPVASGARLLGRVAETPSLVLTMEDDAEKRAWVAGLTSCISDAVHGQRHTPGHAHHHQSGFLNVPSAPNALVSGAASSDGGRSVDRASVRSAGPGEVYDVIERALDAADLKLNNDLEEAPAVVYVNRIADLKADVMGLEEKLEIALAEADGLRATSRRLFDKLMDTMAEAATARDAASKSNRALAAMAAELESSKEELKVAESAASGNQSSAKKVTDLEKELTRMKKVHETATARVYQLEALMVKAGLKIPAAEWLLNEVPQEAMVLKSTEANDDTELALTEGEVIIVHRIHHSGWWKGETMEGDSGIFPSWAVQLARPPRSTSLTLDPDALKAQEEAEAAAEAKTPVLKAVMSKRDRAINTSSSPHVKGDAPKKPPLSPADSLGAALAAMSGGLRRSTSGPRLVAPPPPTTAQAPTKPADAKKPTKAAPGSSKPSSKPESKKADTKTSSSQTTAAAVSTGKKQPSPPKAPSRTPSKVPPGRIAAPANPPEKTTPIRTSVSSRASRSSRSSRRSAKFLSSTTVPAANPNPTPPQQPALATGTRTT